MWIDESDFFLRMFAVGLAGLFWLITAHAVFVSPDYQGAAAVGLIAAINTAIAVGAHRRLKVKRVDDEFRRKEKPKARDWMGNPKE